MTEPDKNIQAEKVVLDLVGKNQRAIDVLGSGIHHDGFVTGSETFSGLQGSAQLDIPVVGDKGGGSVLLEAEENNGKWEFQTLKLVHGDIEVNLLEK